MAFGRILHIIQPIMIMQGRVNSSGTAPMATTQFQLNTSPTAAAATPPTNTLRGSSQRRAGWPESDDEVDASELQLFMIDTSVIA
ncbi:hypothetical protein SAOR_01685 [Salinisphaera orenii MK-B5]|uniref:Uncharacterized protein n=2 Tax=Salinisphaera TaxID=180541 RepID=A0A423PYE2_9GAMM|nr:hypothetical protein SAOR_01685 [Salinisphaera orenii MK-B5]